MAIGPTGCRPVSARDTPRSRIDLRCRLPKLQGMTIYRDGTTYLVMLDADRAFLHRSDTGETSAIAHPQTFVARRKDAAWELLWDETLPASLLAAIRRMSDTPDGEDPARGSVGPAG